jgi:crotonobetainyl-CoA:carnitine CoA-transferase CaiB-like acyl-CoA transferase
MLDFQAARYLIAGEVPGQEGNSHPTGAGTGMFETSDGHINVAATGDSVWEKFCKATGATDLLTNPDFATPVARTKNRTAVRERIASIIRSNTNAHWVELLNKAGVPCGPINTIDKVFADPQVKHLGIATPIDHPKYGAQTVVGQPIHLSRYPQPKKLNHTPEPGEHTDEILKKLGYDDARVAALRAKGAV